MYLKQKYVVRIFQKDIEFLSKTHTCRDFLQMRQLIIFTPFSPFKGSPLEQVFSKDINFCNKQKRKQINIEVCFHCPKKERDYDGIKGCGIHDNGINHNGINNNGINNNGINDNMVIAS